MSRANGVALPPRPLAAMLKTRIIPCLDVKDGRVVKGVNFVDLVDAGDPVEAAMAYDAAGADELCFLDITASHEDRGILLDVVAARPSPLHAGDRRRRRAHGRGHPRLLLAGADKVSINSAAVDDRALGRARGGKIRRPVHRGGDRREKGFRPRRGRAGRCSPMAAAARPGSTRSLFAREVVSLGAGEILLTSMDRDGTSTATTSRSPAPWPTPCVPVVASGGVGTLDHLVEGVAKAGERGAGGLDLPFRQVHDSRGQGRIGGGGVPVRRGPA